MAGTQALDASLLAVAAAAREQAKEAQRERAKAMDAIIDLLIERATMREYLRECLPYLWVSTARAAAIAGEATMPKVLVRRIEGLLEGTPEAQMFEVERSLQDRINQEEADAARAQSR